MKSRSQQLVAAVRLLGVGWLASHVWYWFFDGADRSWGYAVINAVLAICFWNMARRRWFPAPLFVLHALLVIVQALTALAFLNSFWFSLLANRIFELALVYIVFCAGFILLRGPRAANSPQPAT
ncbi:MAG: hypothetical protein AAFY22_06830 [Pseudomonadota bacterium]